MRLRMLVAYSMSSTGVSTTRAYLEALSRHTGFDVSYIHVTHDAILDVDPAEYDVVFHNYCGRLCFPGYLSESYRNWLKNFKGLKVAAIQDEYDFTNNTKAAIKELGFNIVLTCVPQDQLEYVYPKAEFPGVAFVTVLTGYVPDEGLAEFNTPPLRDRAIHVGYRGNRLPARYGRLGFEKFDIGRRVKMACEERGIPHDIAMDNASRIYGQKWFEFIGSCRVILGAESGCNAFDFDGSLDRTLKMLEAEKGRAITYEEFKDHIGDREKDISMGQISPRVFEAAAMRTPMVLFRGKYSGIIEPELHYIPLEKDYSNLDEVLSRLSDITSLERMADRAYNELVASKKYTYSAYGKFLRDLISEHYSALCAEGKIPDPVAGRQSTAPSANQDLENFLKLQRPTEFPLSMAYLNWAYYRGARAKLHEEVDRLWKVYDELHEHAVPWAVRTANTYAKQLGLLKPAQRRKPKLAALPDDLPLQRILTISEKASAYRIVSYRDTPSTECVVPLPDKVDKAAAEEEKNFESYRATIANITEYIEELQREFNIFCDVSTRYISMLNAAMSSMFTIYLPVILLRRVKYAIVRRIRAS